MKRVLAFATVLLFGALLASPAFAVTEDTTPGANLGGYDALSSSMAFSFQPFLPALVSTGDVPFEGTFGLATSHVKSGGNSFGRGALIWPGSTAADFGPIVGVLFGQPQVGGLVPKWPVQAQATQDDGEVKTGVEPLVAMRALGQGDRGEGSSHIASVDVPGVLTIEHVTSSSSSVVSDTSVTSISRTALQGVSMLKGHITADAIRSTSTTTSIGSAASSAGDVDIVGLKIGGVDVSVTDDGFRVGGVPPQAGQAPGTGDKPFPNASPEEIVNQTLKSLGVRITLFNSISSVVGGRAEHMEPGVIISVVDPVGGTGPVPPGHFDIVLAASSSSSFGTLPFSPDGIIDTGGGSSSDGTSGGGSITIGDGPTVGGNTVSNVGGGLGAVASGGDLTGGTQQALDGVVTEHTAYHFGGVPFGLAMALLLLALIAARAIRNFFNRLIGARGVPADSSAESSRGEDE